VSLVHDREARKEVKGADRNARGSCRAAFLEM